MKAGLDIDTGHIGNSRVSQEFRTSTNRFIQFAKAVGDTNPLHLSGQVAPPVFAHIPVMQSMVEVFTQFTDAFVMHGEHDFVFHRHMVPGERLFSTSTLLGMDHRSFGVTLVIASTTYTQAGEPVCTQYSTCLVAGARIDAPAGQAVPARPAMALNGSCDTFEYALLPHQTRLYADAARDYAPYTLVPEVARRLGFPAPIVHGMCTLSYACRAIVDHACNADTRRLKRLGCRFSRPLLLIEGQRIVVNLRQGGSGFLAFDAADMDGQSIVSRGYAEVAP